MSFNTVFTWGIILLSINIAVIIYLLFKSWKREEHRVEQCRDCYYRDSREDDFTPCRMCDDGSQFKDYGEGQTEDIKRDWRM